MTTTTCCNEDCSVHTHSYIGFLPDLDEMYRRGWEFDWMGAEGPMYKKITSKGIFHLQIIQQGIGNESVINLNNNIKGYQNLHITQVDDHYKTLYFGTIWNYEHLDQALELAGIK